MGGIAETTVTGRLAVLGAHGGAGARTVTELLRRAGAEVGRLRVGDRLPADATPVLVTRSTAAGLAAVGDLLAAWHPDVPPPWLVVVADLPAPPPATVRYRVRALSGQVRGAVTVPYLWPLRAASRLDEVGETRAVRRAGRELAAALAGVSR
jgi:hypothetical protein